MTTDAFSFSFADESKENSTPAPPEVSAPNQPTNDLAVNDLAPNELPSNDSSPSDPFASDDPFAGTDPFASSDPFAAFDFGAQNSEESAGEVQDEAQAAADFAADPFASIEFDHLEPDDHPISEKAEQTAPQTLDFGLEMPDFGSSNPLIAAGAELPTLRSEGEILETEPQMPLEIPDAPVVPASPHQMVDAEEKDDPFAPFIKAPPRVPIVAILGASGIGKNHARWFTKHDCRVAAFLGRDEGTLSNTSAIMHDDFGFDGEGYRDLGALLREVKPEIVCVSTPSELHFAHALAALEAGAHVLCEKPLVYAPNRKARENLDGARELVKVAKQNNLLLGTQLQYGAATPILCKLAGLTPPEVGDFAMEIETTNPNAPRDPHDLWLDLGPHPIAVAQFLAGEGATLISDSLQFFTRKQGEGAEASARFGVQRADGRMLAVRAITRYVPSTTISHEPYRRFSFNGRVVAYNGRRLKTGQYIAQYTAPDGYDNVYPDPVDFLVGNFVRAVKAEEELLIDGEFGRQNLEWLLKIGA